MIGTIVVRVSCYYNHNCTIVSVSYLNTIDYLNVF